MNRYLLLLVMTLTCKILAAQKNIIKEDVPFDFNSAKITASVALSLEEAFNRIPVKSTLQLNITGDIDSTATKRFRNKISAQRAEALRNFFIAKGVEFNHIVVSYSCHSGKPLTSANLSRKVNIPSEYQMKIYKAPLIGPVSYTRCNLTSLSKKEGQCFGIDPVVPNELAGAEGTRLQFKANSFVYLDGKPVKEKVTICLREFYSMYDMMLEDLVTVSNGKMLETGGMIHVKADCEGTPVFIKKGLTFSIHIPAAQLKKGMRMFVGETKSELVNWKVTACGNKNEAYISTPVRSYKYDTSFLEKPFSEGTYGVIVNEGEEEAGVLDYQFESSKLDWINCDRFYEVQDKTNLFVTLDSTSHVAVRMVFKDTRSVLPACQYNNNQVQFTNVPIGMKVLVICYTVRNNKDVFMTYKEMTITQGDTPQLTLQPSSLHEMKELLARYD